MISLKKLSQITGGRGKSRPVLVFELVKPMREWAYCLLVATVTALGLIAYIGFDFYSQFNTVEVSATDMHHKRSPYSVELGRTVLNVYEERSRRFDALLTETVATPEPRLPSEGGIQEGVEGVGGGAAGTPAQREDKPVLESVQ